MLSQIPTSSATRILSDTLLSYSWAGPAHKEENLNFMLSLCYPCSHITSCSVHASVLVAPGSVCMDSVCIFSPFSIIHKQLVHFRPAPKPTHLDAEPLSVKNELDRHPLFNSLLVQLPVHTTKRQQMMYRITGDSIIRSTQMRASRVQIARSRISFENASQRNRTPPCSTMQPHPCTHVHSPHDHISVSLPTKLPVFLYLPFSPQDERVTTACNPTQPMQPHAAPPELLDRGRLPEAQPLRPLPPGLV